MKHQNIHRDKLFFDYLEGNLSGNERSALEVQMESNPAMKDEVDMWKLTFLTEPFSATPWNQLLIKPVRKSKWALFLNSFTFGFLLFVASGNSKEEFLLPTKDKSIVQTPKMDNTPYAALWDSASVYRIENKVSSQKIEMIEVGYGTKETDGRLLSISSEWPLTLQKPVSIFSIKVNTKFEPIVRPLQRVKSVSNYRRVSRKELRSINRKKRKQHALTIEKEFMKGNVPYVVPLDLKNF